MASETRTLTLPPWRCPTHHAPVDRRGDELVCPEGDSFPIRDDIPRFVAGSGYATAFGAQWRRYRLTQLDSHTGATITRDRARRCIGEEIWNALEGMQVLECGCGAGRFTEVLLERGALVTSVDLSDAVDANQENFPQDARHQIAQADILDLPFPPGQFDLVFCLGVVQHTPIPEQTIASLYEQVRPGGHLVFDHYSGARHKRLLTLRPLYRIYLRRLPAEKGLRRSEQLVALFLPLHRKAGGRWQKALKLVSPVQSYYHTFPQLSDELQLQWALLDTHDGLTDWYKHFRSPGQIRDTLKSLGLEEISCTLGGNGVEARGRRPSHRSTGRGRVTPVALEVGARERCSRRSNRQ